MTTQLTAWEPYVYPYIPDAPNQALLTALRASVQEYLEMALLWTEWLTAINIVALTSAYTLSLPAGLSTNNLIEAIDQVWFKENGADNDQYTPLDPIDVHEKDEELRTAWKYQSAPNPSGFYMEESEENVINLWPIPTAASTSGLLPRVFVKTKLTITSVEDWIFNRHRDAITEGALAFLFKMKGMPWYDPNEGLAHRALFENKTANAKNVQKTGQAVRKPTQVAFRNWI